MKKITFTLFLVLLGFCAEAQVPTFGFQTVALTNSFVAGTTTYSFTTHTGLLAAPYLDVSKQGSFTFSSTISASTGGATNIYTFAPSADGINFDTNSIDMLSYTNATVGGGTNTSVKTWTLIGAVRAYGINTIVTTGTATNLSQGYAQKISAP